MDVLVYLSNFMVPMIVFLIVSYGIVGKVKVYDVFLDGAKKGFHTVVRMLPTLVGLMVAVGVLRASGFLDFLADILGILGAKIGFPAELMPLTMVRLFSTSAATGLVLDIFKEYGTDSRLGTLASVIMSCTESAFYIMSVYFMAVQVKKTRYVLAGALVSTAVAVVVSVLIM